MINAGLMRGLVIAFAIIGYAILANYTNQSTHSATLGVLVALAPLILTGIIMTWHATRRGYLIATIIVTTSLAWLMWPMLELHYGWIYWLEHESLQWALLLTFARTLRQQRQPLCTQLATIVHGELTPLYARYTYQVTVAWTAFFALMIIISTSLFFLQPIAVWSIFANFIFMPLVAVMFIAEYAVRKIVRPELAQVNIMDAVRAFMQHSAHRH
ncbi:hypothetical protein [Sulfuriferula nivalis]|uniref:Transmembrane protein n=1 Tax=Sulfuriferula nivalis TaxID=2675298 RepID=A0A809RNQ8_9PROT|nr:hypothetical protein [Sulfuriferula nivalis]BBP02414.1 hypothetical protein SFSGTM_31220 [Sulfuriferula nivalis]